MTPFEQEMLLADYATYGFKVVSNSHTSIGNTVAILGDVNDDGYDDFLVSGYGAYGSFIVFGNPNGFANLVLETMTAAQGIKISSEVAGEYLGGNATQTSAVESASAAGDVNGDGIDDIILGAIYNDQGGTDAGAAYVLFGKTSGFGQVNLAALAPADGFKLIGDMPGDWTGYGVANAGDFNDDGYDDIIVGAPNSDAGGIDSGAAYLIYGKAGGFGPIDLAAIPAGAGFKIRGDAPGDRAGTELFAAGDVNGDGIDDIMIRGGSKVHVVYGRTDGYTSLDLSDLTLATGFTVSNISNATFAGDVNGDGLGDMLLARGSYNLHYVLFGKPGGHANLDASTLTSDDAYIISGFANGPISPAGDIDADGYDDVLISTQTPSPWGGVFLAYGKGTDLEEFSFHQASEEQGFEFVGDSQSNRTLYSMSGGGDLNGDGYDDFLLASNGYA